VNIDRLTSFHSPGERLADVRHQLHLVWIVEREQGLAGCDSVTDVDLLIHHDAIHRRADRRVCEHRP